MESHNNKYFLKKLMSGKITPADFQQLKENTTHIPDEELDNEIKTLWEETTEVTPMNKQIKEEVLLHIHKQTKPISRPIHKRWMAIAAAVILPLMVSIGSFYYFSQKQMPTPQEFIVMAESGQKTKVLLPDGTQVWLNSESRLSYSSDFNNNNRKVKLDGEAFFDVEKNSDQHFTVETDCINVVVYGTAFNVIAYKEEPTIDVSLLRGKVGIENKENHSLATLSPDQLISLSKKDMKWSVRDCDAQIESLWTQNKLKFENAPASEVFRKLERWYGMIIEVENMNEEIRYGFTLKSESLREMLNEINKITPITYKIDGEKVSITYRNRKEVHPQNH